MARIFSLTWCSVFLCHAAKELNRGCGKKASQTYFRQANQKSRFARVFLIRQIALSSQILMATAFFLDFLTAAKDQEDVLVFLFPPPLFQYSQQHSLFKGLRQRTRKLDFNEILSASFFPDDFHFTRKKKHPEIAHRSHEFFDPSLAPAFPTRASHNQYDSSRERVRNPFYCKVIPP